MPKKYRINYIDKVLDPIHGFIDITEVESKIIELPIFKRLQSIKQLSLTNWIFPGAEHTRYIHSLGVMHVADMMAKQLRYSEEDRQLVRLAGLLHDIGHYPLSHVTEGVYLDNLTKTDDALEKHNKRVLSKIEGLNQLEFPNYMQSRYALKAHHESMGALVIENDEDIKSIITTHCPFINIEDICDIIVGCTENTRISGLVQLIHSELDADGIDYIMRDSTFSGTCYGGFELGLLLRNLTRRKVNDVEIIGIKPKGIAIADQYLISKYFSYTQIIFNKHVTIFELMAEFITKEMVRDTSIIYPDIEDLRGYVKSHNKNDFYMTFTDVLFWSNVKEIKQKEGKISSYLINMANKLTKYQELPIRSEEFAITSNSKDDVYKAVKRTKIYKDLCLNNNTSLVSFNVRGFTTQMPEKVFINLLNTLKGGECDPAEMKKEKLKRMQEGIMVIEKGKPIKALVDNPNSIMSHLYDTKTYILREYNIDDA